MIRQVSLIIPSYNDNSKLIKLLKSIPDWVSIPNEIIVVDSSHSEPFIPEDVSMFSQKHDIKMTKGDDTLANVQRVNYIVYHQ